MNSLPDPTPRNKTCACGGGEQIRANRAERRLFRRRYGRDVTWLTGHADHCPLGNDLPVPHEPGRRKSWRTPKGISDRD